MTSYEWDAHKAKWCERCKHNNRRRGCPALAIMDRTPDDMAANKLFRLGKCSQYEKKPERPKKRKATGDAK